MADINILKNKQGLRIGCLLHLYSFVPQNYSDTYSKSVSFHSSNMGRKVTKSIIGRDPTLYFSYLLQLIPALPGVTVHFPGRTLASILSIPLPEEQS